LLRFYLKPLKTSLNFCCLLLFFGLQLCSCTEKSSGSLFTLTSQDKTGITFSNTIQENETFNIFTYQYLYNGGGVALGDVNGDGKTDVFFTGNMVPNRLYLNEGDLKFKDITPTAGVAGRKQWKTGACMADVNGDGLLDIYVCYSGPGTDAERKNELYINNGVKNGTISFTESGEKYGLDAPGTFTTQAVFFDMDRDNDLDVFMVNHADMFYNSFFNTHTLRNRRHPKFGNRLYKNDNGHFIDISNTAGIFGGGINFGLSATISDVNNDGWPDIYTTNDYNEQDFLYLNNQDNTFREVLKRSMGHISKFSMGSDIADYNNDLRPDIVTVDMLPEDNKRQKLLKGPDGHDVYQLLVDSGFYYQDMRNMLQMNVALKDSVPVFSEIGQLSGISNTDWSWAPLFCDLNNDGWKDLYVTNGYLRDFTNMDFLKYTFQQETADAQAKGQSVNNWELVKKMPSTKISNYCYSNNQNVTFTDQTKAWGLYQPSISTGASYGDLDNDGDLDLVVNNSNDVASVFENHSSALLENHYLKIRLQGEGLNPFAIGAKVIIQTDSTEQMQELYPVHGFQSSVEPQLHFGLGVQQRINVVQVLWPDGKHTQLKNLGVDTTITISVSGSSVASSNYRIQEGWFTDITEASGLFYTHKETETVDFKSQFLLPYQVSKQGPFLTKGDVNGDGLEDVFVGGNDAHHAVLFLQSADANFKPAPTQPWLYSPGAKDEEVLFFDADGDNDLDLFVVRGGSELPIGDNGYQDQLYLNDGKGLFQNAIDALPPLLANGSCVAATDYDKDGDTDLFIGGRSVSGRFPEADFSYLLRNETKEGKVRFEYASEQPDKSLRHPGIVTSAVWGDVNKDGWEDLIIAGTFMPITIYENKNGSLMDATAAYGLDKSNGMWNKIVADDLDNDGDVDFIAGNLGLNSQLRASSHEPVTMCYGDFDGNGSVDPLLCYYIQGKQWPLASLDELAEQLPSVRKTFLRYEQYASASLDQILSPQQLRNAKTLQAYTLATAYIENKGNNRFELKPMPLSTQVSSVKAILVGDIDRNGKKDLVLHGNDHTWRAQLGKIDASYGIICTQDDRGMFHALPVSQTGLITDGDVRAMITVQSNKGTTIICTRNNGKMAAVKMKS
jgi:hypothetical protein